MKNHDIFITGAHRSGSSWIGRMIQASGGYLLRDEEIFNSASEVARSPFQEMYTYVCRENEAVYHPYIQALVQKRYDLWGGLRQARTVRDIGRVAKRKLRSIGRRFQGDRPQIFIEPIGLFSTEWFAETFQTPVIVLIRHPAAFVSSLKKLNWGFNFSHLSQQELLMDRHLSRFRGELANPPRRPDLIGMGILQWRIFYSFVKTLQERHPEWIFVRQEDLASNPIDEFRKLFVRLNLPMTPHAEEVIRRHSDPSNPAEFKGGRDASRRNSRETIRLWKERLSPEEVDRVRRETESVWRIFYKEDHWN